MILLLWPFLWTSHNEDTLIRIRWRISKCSRKTFTPELLIKEVSQAAAGVVFSGGGAGVQLDGVSLIRGGHETSALSLRLFGPGPYPIHWPLHRPAPRAPVRALLDGHWLRVRVAAQPDARIRAIRDVHLREQSLGVRLLPAHQQEGGWLGDHLREENQLLDAV